MGKTLLLADDSVTIQKVVGISFASEDIAIKTVDNGDDAISRARELRPDVILADVVMPGKSGYEVCEAIKADPALRHIPVLLLTGTFEAFDEQRAARAGAAGHVAKPFEAQTLVERVKALLAATPKPAPAPPRAEPAAAAAVRPAPAARPVPASPAAAPPAPARAADQAFDFFDDPLPAEPVEAEASSARDLEVEAPDAVFAFGDDELSASDPQFVSPSPPPLPRAAATVAILPGDVPRAGAGSGTARPLPPRPPPIPQKAPVARPSAPPAADFDFEFESVGAGAPARTPASRIPEPHTDLAEATLLDPAASSAFDVSSSDLGSLVMTREPVSAAATQLIDHPMSDEDEAIAEEIPNARQGDSAHVDPTPDLLAEEDDAAWSEQAIETEPDLILHDRPAAAQPARAPEPMRAPEPRRPQPARSEAQPSGRPPSRPAAEIAHEALAQVAPVLREQLHETLERIAWEAFGSVTETVVEQAVERLEKIAWEVVPKLAEALILEEIRKLKSE
jgi:CheY-like chemotaxis protein